MTPSDEHRDWKRSHARMCFICYRRDDLKGLAEAVNQYLRRRFPGQIWFDTDDEGGIPFGVSWEADLDNKLRACRVLLALIGPGWAGQSKADSKDCRRIDDSKDWVRREIGQALAAQTQVIPVLLEPPPGEEPFHALARYTGQLPEDIKKLSNLQIATIRSGPGFGRDADRLAAQIRGQLISPLYAINLGLMVASAIYFGAWLYGATLQTGLAVISVAAALLLAGILFFLRKFTLVQVLRGLFSGSMGTVAALVVAFLLLLVPLYTPILRVDREGLEVTAYDGETAVAGGHFRASPNPIVGMPLWFAGHGPVTLDLRVPGYPATCGEARRRLRLGRVEADDLRSQLGRNFGRLVVGDEFSQACGDCTPKGPMTIRFEVRAYLDGKLVASPYDGPYRSLWVGGVGGDFKEEQRADPVIAETLPCNWKQVDIKCRLSMYNSGDTWVHDAIGSSKEFSVKLNPGQVVDVKTP